MWLTEFSQFFRNVHGPPELGSLPNPNPTLPLTEFGSVILSLNYRCDCTCLGSPGTLAGKESSCSAMQETSVRFLVWEDPLERA